MEKKFKIVTLCGSTRFKEEFIKTQHKLAMEGNIVLSLDFYSKSENIIDLLDDEIKHLQEIHNEKIKLSDEIFVINVGGYIGESTRKEIEFARSLNKEISYLEEVPRINVKGCVINLINLYCPFCKTYHDSATKEDIKNSIRISCNACGRSIVLDDLLMIDDIM